MASYQDFLSPISFNMPSWLQASGWIEHGPFGMWLVEQLQPRVIVELGSYHGYSLLCFCQAMKTLGQNGRAIAVDTWKGDAHAGFYPAQIYAELKAEVDANYADMVELKRMLFSEALPSVPDGSVDLLHIDGRHYYDDVKEDHTSWIKKLSPRAVVLFHDTQVQRAGFGVWRYWEELTKQHPHSFEFLHGNGLGVLAPNPDALPPSIAALLSPSLPIPVRDEVRRIYARLGEGCGSTQIARHEFKKKMQRRAMRRTPIKYLMSRLQPRGAGTRA